MVFICFFPFFLSFLIEKAKEQKLLFLFMIWTIALGISPLGSTYCCGCDARGRTEVKMAEVASCGRSQVQMWRPTMWTTNQPKANHGQGLNPNQVQVIWDVEANHGQGQSLDSNPNHGQPDVHNLRCGGQPWPRHSQVPPWRPSNYPFLREAVKNVLADFVR